MDTLDYVAIYGAAVATGALIWNGIAVYRDRTCIKVKVAWALRYVGVPGYEPEYCISLTAINKGRRPVTLSGAGLSLSNRMDIAYNPQQREFPRLLNEGQQHTVFLEEDSVKEALAKFPTKVDIKFAWFRDQTDRLYKTRLHKNMKTRLLG